MHTALLYNKIVTNNNVFISSLVVGIAYVGYELLQPTYQGDGLGEIANGLGYIFIGIILIPIIFGIVGFVFSKERRFVQAFTSFGISLAVMLVLMLAGGAWSNMERARLYPSTDAPVLPSDSPQRKQN